MRPVPVCAAIVLAGGRGRRMAGHDKPVVPVGGRPMLLRVLDALAGTAPRIVVGPPRQVPPGVLVIREEPPGGGPVAAVAAGLDLLDDEPFVAIVAADQPFLTATAVTALRRTAATAATDCDGAVFVDGDRRQLLCGVWRLSAVRRRLAALDDPTGVAVRALLGGLRVAPVRPSALVPPPWYDCDTVDDVERAERWLAEGVALETGAAPTTERGRLDEKESHDRTGRHPR